MRGLRAALIVLLAAACAWLLRSHQEWFSDPRMVKVEVLAWGVWAPTIYILLYAVGPSLLVPGAVMTVAGGLAFGALWGAVYALIGAEMGAMVAFGAGRFLTSGFVQKMFSGRFARVMEQVARHGFQLILYLRLVPVIPYNALNLLAGASPIAFGDYFWASAIGMIPGTILFAFLGDALWHPASPRFFIALGLIALMMAGSELWRRSGYMPGSQRAPKQGEIEPA